MKVNYLILFLLVLFSVSCSNSSDTKIIKQKPGKNEIADINRYFVQKDRERIQNYNERKNLTMKESPAGLWYFIKNEGTGKLFTDNDKISVDYVCSLLDGTECYNSDKLGPKEYILGKSEIEAGLNEGFRLLKPGGEAIFILPPFLAYGLVGDGKSIPSRAVLVYEIKIRNGK
ncbi:MAG: peptidylprolyl isomerase [Odoribacter sp.]|nr:peptidylprolyl isomerase [Odoribacter sp.]